MTRSRIICLILLLLGLIGPEAGLRAQDAKRSDRFYVAGVYEPRGERIVWREGFWTARRAGWMWVPAGWVQLRAGWGFQPGFWVPAGAPAAVPGGPPNLPPGVRPRRLTVIMPGPGIPDVHNVGPYFIDGDADGLAPRLVGPLLPPEVVRSQERLSAMIDGRPVDWEEIAARRARMAEGLNGLPISRPPAAQPPAARPSNAGTGDGLGAVVFPPPAYYIGHSLPGTSYPSYSSQPTAIPGQSTYIGNSLPGTSYPSYAATPSGVPGQSYYIGNSLPGTSYPSYGIAPGMSINGYGYGTAPPGNTAGQASGP